MPPKPPKSPKRKTKKYMSGEGVSGNRIYGSRYVGEVPAGSKRSGSMGRGYSRMDGQSFESFSDALPKPRVKKSPKRVAAKKK